jgi:ATP-binding cassette, subfamily F, member 3
MIVLQASHIEKQFDGTPVLVDASLIVQTRDRVALIGSNGAGKSTLLRILIGELDKDKGDVSFGKGVSTGYISQFVEVDETTNVYQYVANVFASIYELEEKMHAAEREMAKPEVYENAARFESISETYAALSHQFEEQGGYAVEAKIRRVLSGLGFGKSLQELPVGSLSGGQKTRLSLARLLAWQPGLLVLDEPTNYLDTETLTWLEGYLQGYEGALLVVSHDRYFLDQVATEIIELDRGRTTTWHGNYSRYMEQKADRLEVAEKEYEAQQKEIAKMEDFIQRNIVRSSTTKRAQSRRKMLTKMELAERPTGDGPELGLRFSTTRPSGKDVLLAENIAIGYGRDSVPGPVQRAVSGSVPASASRPVPGQEQRQENAAWDRNRWAILAQDIRLRVERGQRIAIVGPNGTGKTTLLKTIIGELPPITGEIRWGQHVQIGYFDQEQTTLDFHKCVLDQVWDEHRNFDNTMVRTALARFLFRGDDLQKPVSALSGGERSRLNLCRLMLQHANTLLLDEPTNHLDLMSKEVLEDALSEYDGTIIFISHDRYFIDAIATHVAVLSETGIQLFIGNYSDYCDKKASNEKWAEDDEQSGSGGPDDRSSGGVSNWSPSKGANRDVNFGTNRGNGSRKLSTSSKSSAEGRLSTVDNLPSNGELSTSGKLLSGGELYSDNGGLAKAKPEEFQSPRGGDEKIRVRSSDIRKARERVSQIEAKSEANEARQTEIAPELNDAVMSQNVDKMKALQSELEQLQTEQENLLEEWSEAAAYLEKLVSLDR